MNSALEQWNAYVASLHWQKGHLDQSSWSAFLRAGSLHVDQESAVQRVATMIVEAGDHARAAKLSQQLRRAYQYASGHPGDPANIAFPRVGKPTYEPAHLERMAQRLDCEIDADWLAHRSPVTTWNRSPAGALHKLFRPGEKVVVFNVYRSQGACVWEHLGPGQNLATLDDFQNFCEEGCWFLCNPIDGQWNNLDRLKTQFNPTGRSRRAEENVTSWRYCVIESDAAPKDLWLKLLVQLPLPIAAITDSGGNSIHALVRIDADTKPEWDRIVRVELLPDLTRLGADPGALTGVRLTRLPNCRRGEKNAYQQLLYLDPDPDLTPICKKEVLYGD